MLKHLQPLPISEEMLGAYLEGNLTAEEVTYVDSALQTDELLKGIVDEVNRDGIRRMTPREWARLQGFPDSFIIGVADASAYKQFGNSVAVPAIQATGEEIIKRINLSRNTKYGYNGK